MVNGLSIYAGYNQYGVNELNIVKLNSTPVSVNPLIKTITLGKDSIRSAAGNQSGLL